MNIPFVQACSVAVSESGRHSVAVALLANLRRARDHIDGTIASRWTWITKGVIFLQEPADRPYGVEAVIRDNSGDWLVLVEHKESRRGISSSSRGLRHGVALTCTLTEK